MSSFKTINCKKHGEYTAKSTTSGTGQYAREFLSSCPKCEEERISYNIKEVESCRIGTIESAFRCVNIPKRYKSGSLSDITPMNDKQSRIIVRCESFIEKYNDLKSLGTSLIFTGKPGTGKTMIALSMIKPIIEKVTNADFVKLQEKAKTEEFHTSDLPFSSESPDIFKYINTYDLFMEIKATYNKNSERTEKEVITKYTSTDILILDEVGAQSGSDYEITTMFRIINSRYENLKPTFLISNLSEEDLSEYIGERTIDRFYENHGAVFVFDWESHRRS